MFKYSSASLLAAFSLTYLNHTTSLALQYSFPGTHLLPAPCLSEATPDNADGYLVQL